MGRLTIVRAAMARGERGFESSTGLLSRTIGLRDLLLLLRGGGLSELSGATLSQ